MSETEGGTYWVNGQKNILNPNGELTGITVSGGKIYVSGFVYGSSASYWVIDGQNVHCLLYTSPSPRDGLLSRMPSSA